MDKLRQPAKLTSASGSPDQSAEHTSRLTGEHVYKHLYLLALLLVLVGIIWHQTLFMVGGTIMLLIIGTIDIWTTYSLRALKYTYRLSEQRATFGEDITLSISIDNAKLLPLPLLELKKVVPRALPLKDHPMRKMIISNITELEDLISLRSYERVTRTYTIHCINRGIYTFGPTRLRSNDIFGFLSRELTIPEEKYLLVYPLVVSIENLNLPSRHPFGNYQTRQRLLEDPSHVIGLRDYVYGDSLRRIDWKATARSTQLQSKIYASTTTYTLAIFLNAFVQLDKYYSIHPDLQELAICTAASIATWGLNENFAVGLYANSGLHLPDQHEIFDNLQGAQLTAAIAAQVERRRLRIPPASNQAQHQRLMEALARLQPHMSTPLEEVIYAERAHLPIGTTLIVITHSVNERLVDMLTHMQRNGHAVALIFVGNAPTPLHLANIKIYHLGGTETWEKLQQEAEAGETEIGLPGFHL